MQILNIFHVLVAIAMVAFVLVQRGPGATAGAAFGSGASGTVFGSRGAGSFLSRTTWILATLFCVISLTMAVIVSRTVAAPETDLGVVGTAQPETPAIEVSADDLPVLDDSGQDSDLPDVNTSSDTSPDTTDGVTSGDLPSLDETGADEDGVPGEDG